MSRRRPSKAIRMRPLFCRTVREWKRASLRWRTQVSLEDASLSRALGCVSSRFCHKPRWLPLAAPAKLASARRAACEHTSLRTTGEVFRSLLKRRQKVSQYLPSDLLPRAGGTALPQHLRLVCQPFAEWPLPDCHPKELGGWVVPTAKLS
eukprot:2482668-Amphidinium_carterae.1